MKNLLKNADYVRGFRAGYHAACIKSAQLEEKNIEGFLLGSIQNLKCIKSAQATSIKNFIFKKAFDKKHVRKKS